MFLDINITSDQIAAKDQELRSMSYDKKSEAWLELQEFFGPKETSVNDQKYWYSYFRWYVELTAKRFIEISKEVLIDDVAPRMIAMMIMLDYDVWQNIMWYFTMVPMEQKEIEGLYSQMHNAFINSSSILGKYKNKDITQKELVSEIKMLNNQGNDSLKMAALRTKIKETLFPGGELEDKFIFVNKDEAVGKFIDITHFFIGVSVEDIYYVIDGYQNGAKYEALSSQPEKLTPQEQTEVDKIIVESPQPVQTSQEKPESELIQEIKPEDIKINTQKPTPQEIKLLVEAKYKKDDTGHFEDLEGVFGYLQELAQQHEDPNITDLLYFDEASGAFLWNE